MPEIMTLKDVAEYLRVNERTVAKMAQEGRIPSTKVASQWRFSKEAIDDWFVDRMRLAGTAIGNGAPRFELAKLLRSDLVKLELESRSKDAVLEEMSALLTQGRVVTSRKRLLKVLRERERLCSTGVGRGTAFLHPRKVIPELVSEPALAFGRSSQGIEFDAVDGKPVHFFFLDCATSERMHLSILARLSRILADDKILLKLTKAGRADEVVAALEAAEGRLVAS